MCTTTSETLTLAGMLADPLILMAMQRDGISEDDWSDLLFRVKDTLAARCQQEHCGTVAVA
ncbi:MAG: hypothetical protein AB7F35_23520 [Acetobacteraceae bacterium]